MRDADENGDDGCRCVKPARDTDKRDGSKIPMKDTAQSLVPACNSWALGPLASLVVGLLSCWVVGLSWWAGLLS